MEKLFAETPPWKNVEWMPTANQPPPSIPEILYTNVWQTEENPEIIKIKQTIEDLDKEHRWELAKKMVNIYELVYTHNDDRLPPSLSLISPLSRSFFKMVEILDIMQFFKDTPTKIVSAHIAEGPGGFIQALYNMTEPNKKTMIGSIAMTLKPTNSHVPGWKKATQFLQRNKQVAIHYGADGTGDVYKEENRATYIEQVGVLGGAHIFTADGGFDFSVDYALQEQHVFNLLLCSAITGLQVLRKDGCFVLKIFECSSPHTRLFIQLLSLCFKKWTLYKPAMTRPCNSERYFIGKGFVPSAKSAIATLISIQKEVEQNKFPLSPWDLHLPFLQGHIEKSTALQIQFIEAAVVLADKPSIWWETWYPCTLKKSYLWCEHFKVFCTPVNSQISITNAKFPTPVGHTSHRGVFQL